MNQFPLSRRQLLERCSNGFGMLALSSLMAGNDYAGLAHAAEPGTKGEARAQTPKAKNVIFCYMSGGVSQVDSFDPKPRLQRDAGKPIPVNIEKTQFNNNGNLLPSPWKFRQYGQSGLPVSDLFPHVGSVADELAVVRSMTAKFSEHAQANFFMHTGFPFIGHPSAGAWCTYGMGSEANDLPGYVVLRSGGSGIPHGGVSLFSNVYLPAVHQASIINSDAQEAVRNIQPKESDRLQQRRLKLIEGLDRRFSKSVGDDEHVNAAIKNYEMAYRMQSAVPTLSDLSGESPATHRMYGLDSDDPKKAAYGQQCLLARRLVEHGVRFIELTSLAYNIGGGNGANPWDHHGDLRNGHQQMATQVDQPIAALIKDLKQRGLLDQTLIVWAGEFGRTPFSQGTNGRDHDPYGFSIWMAGGGIKGGTTYGATDEFGYHTVENTSTIYDMWATVLHQLGLDHEKLTYRYGGRDFRLTDVHGNVLHDILA